MANKLTLDSKIKDLYQTPVGHDALYKVLLQLNISEKVITNPVIGNVKLRTLAALTKKTLGDAFFKDLLHLVNMEEDVPVVSKDGITSKWWKEAVFYQIYPRSFYDSNNDGIGDLRGIIEKLEYLQELGVDALWLSPIYDSPNDDNGYDIRDYYQIMKEFGTMEDFDELLHKVHEKDMRLIMDLVVNHTSDEHRWFQEALQDPSSKYRKYYYLKESQGVPNNWTSFFSGSAWNYYEKQNLWGLHLFSKKQMDLNWENPDVREDIISMINWWLDKGVDGFRLDVINYISKESGLPQGNETIGKLMGYTGIEHYYYGPHLHAYLREIHEKSFAKYDAFSVGETPGLGMKMAQLVTSEHRKELDMIFSFDHLETPGHIRYEDYLYDLNYFRDYMIDWMLHYGNDCWMSIFYNNHDNPRMISKITKNKEYYESLAILLAIMQMTLKGTPFLFQGDEMGLVNYAFTSMDQITDVEAKGYYKQHIQELSHDAVFSIIVSGTREHTRVLLPWNKKLPAHHASLQQAMNMRVYEVYKELIAMRHQDRTWIYGDFEVLNRDQDRFVYKRCLDHEYIVDCNLSFKKQSAYSVSGEYDLMFPKGVDDLRVLQAYEARIYRKK